MVQAIKLRTQTREQVRTEEGTGDQVRTQSRDQVRTEDGTGDQTKTQAQTQTKEQVKTVPNAQQNQEQIKKLKNSNHKCKNKIQNKCQKEIVEL